MKSSVEKLKKFKTSSSWVGGDSCRYKKLTSPVTIKSTKDEIVRKLRERAEVYESRAERGGYTANISLGKTAKELRDCAVSIRLGSWDDMDEI